MNRFYKLWLPPVKKLAVKSSGLSHSQATLGLNGVGQVAKRGINALNFHSPTGSWIGTSKNVGAPAGAGLGDPTSVTSDAVFWKARSKSTPADTSRNRKSLTPTREAAPPNPGRPEFGGGEREI